MFRSAFLAALVLTSPATGQVLNGDPSPAILNGTLDDSGFNAPNGAIGFTPQSTFTPYAYGARYYATDHARNGLVLGIGPFIALRETSSAQARSPVVGLIPGIAVPSVGLRLGSLTALVR